jgi:hypothetical protein
MIKGAQTKLGGMKKNPKDSKDFSFPEKVTDMMMLN